MKQIRRLVFTAVLMLLGGCMSSGLIDMGHGKYAVEYTSLISHENAREWAYWQAQQTCDQQSRVPYLMSETPSVVRGTATSSLTFMCLEKSDPQLQTFRNYLRQGDIPSF